MQRSIEDFHNNPSSQNASVFWDFERVHSIFLDFCSSHSHCHIQGCHRIWQNVIQFLHLAVDIGLNLIVDLTKNQWFDGIKDESANRVDNSLQLISTVLCWPRFRKQQNYLKQTTEKSQILEFHGYVFKANIEGNVGSLHETLRVDD
jgi:hypothetical protein